MKNFQFDYNVPVDNARLEEQFLVIKISARHQFDFEHSGEPHISINPVGFEYTQRFGRNAGKRNYVETPGFSFALAMRIKDWQLLYLDASKKAMEIYMQALVESTVQIAEDHFELENA